MQNFSDRLKQNADSKVSVKHGTESVKLTRLNRRSADPMQ